MYGNGSLWYIFLHTLYGYGGKEQNQSGGGGVVLDSIPDNVTEEKKRKQKTKKLHNRIFGFGRWESVIEELGSFGSQGAQHAGLAGCSRLV